MRTTRQQRLAATPSEKREEDRMVKMDIVFAVVSIVFLAVILTIVLPIAQEAWKANEHARAVWWSLGVWIIVGVGIAATALPMAYKADHELRVPGALSPTDVAAKQLSDALAKQAELAARQLEATDRPWLAVALALNAPFKATTDEKNINLGFVVAVKNVGKSVAQNVGIRAVLYPQEWGQAMFTEPMKRQQALCTDKPDPSGFLKMTLFEGQEDSLPMSLTLSVDEIAVAAKTFDKKIPYPALIPMIVGCVTYEYPNSARVHHVHFAYEVVRYKPEDPYHPAVFDSKNLPKTLQRMGLLKYSDANAHKTD
jgi:hypothetical protein